MAVGGLAAGLYFAVSLLSAMVFGVAPTASSLLGHAAATGTSYFGHHSITFRRKGSHTQYMPRFALLIVLSGGLNVALMQLVQWLGLPYVVGFCSVAILVPIVNYGFNKYWIFTQR